MNPESGLPLDVVVHHELGHALVGIELGLTVYGVELVPVGDDWGGLTHWSENVPPERVRPFLIAVAAGDQAAIVHCSRSGQAYQSPTQGDHDQFAEILAWAADQDTGPLPSWEAASAEALKVVHRVWGRIAELAPKLVHDKNLVRTELV